MIKTKVVVFSLSMLLISSSLWAQDFNHKKSFRKHEFTLGLGLSKDVFSSLSIDKIFSNIIADMLSKELTYHNTKATNRSGFHLGYAYNFNQRWAVGATLFYKVYDKSHSRYQVESTYKENFYGGAIEGRYTYLNKRVFRMNSLLGVGIYGYHQEWKRRDQDTAERVSDTSTKFTYQISPLCMEIGTFIGLKLEYGYGYKGIASGGLYYKF